MQKSKWFFTATLAAVIAFTSLSVIASADEGAQPEDPPMQQHMEEMKAAVESGDYNTFAEVAPEQMLEHINEGNFGRFQEMHNHLKQAREIGEELGLEKGRRGNNMKGHIMQNREEIRAAVENGDYNAWVELHSQGDHEAKILEFVNEENFSKLGEMHEAIQSQDFETVKQIKEELGLPDRPQTGQMGQKGFARQ